MAVTCVIIFSCGNGTYANIIWCEIYHILKMP